jgi:hypothetical protein
MPSPWVWLALAILVFLVCCLTVLVFGLETREGPDDD